MADTNFRTAPLALPTRSTRRTAGCSFETYLANTIAMNARVEAAEMRLEAAATSIRAALPATEGQLTWGLRAGHSAADVSRALHLMVGSRSGAKTTGEIVVSGWSAGGEVYGAR